MLQLTIVNDIDRSARGENGKRAGVITTSSVCGAVLDLETETESMSTRLCQTTDAWFTLAPLNDGPEPVASVILKVFSGKVLKTPRGSLRSLRVWSPVLVTVAVTLKFPSPSTLSLGIDVVTVKPGVAETAIAEATRATREARREEENIVAKVLKVVGEAAPMRPGD